MFEYPLITGLHGVLYPPHALSNIVFEEKLFQNLAPTGDDIWFWAMAVLNQTKIKRIAIEERYIGIENKNSKALYDFNGVLRTQQLSNTDLQLHNVMKYFHFYEKFNIKSHPEAKD